MNDSSFEQQPKLSARQLVEEEIRQLRTKMKEESESKTDFGWENRYFNNFISNLSIKENASAGVRQTSYRYLCQERGWTNKTIRETTKPEGIRWFTDKMLDLTWGDFFKTVDTALVEGNADVEVIQDLQEDIESRRDLNMYVMEAFIKLREMGFNYRDLTH